MRKFVTPASQYGSTHTPPYLSHRHSIHLMPAMEALGSSPLLSSRFLALQAKPPTEPFNKYGSNLSSNRSRSRSLRSTCRRRSAMKSSGLSAASSTVSTDPVRPPDREIEIRSEEEKFDWFAQWYPIMPVCDLDRRIPHAKKVMGLDIVVWWDRHEGAWKVFEDRCPHRLAPLSEGRIDRWGRLQCVYHGWCFDGSGGCKLIPQAPPDGPPVHSSKRACVAVYPSAEQHEIVWFWPSADPQYKDIILKKKPPYIPELDDPSFTKLKGNRDIPYGYEVLVENLMDPAHVPYAHYGIMRIPRDKKSPKVDREGGRPMEMSIQSADIGGFTSKQERGSGRFIAPCVFYLSSNLVQDQGNGSMPSSKSQKLIRESSAGVTQRNLLLIFICIPVSPGSSRLIWTFPRNFGVWIDQIVPRWMFHVGQNLILDSDLYLLHVEERKIQKIGASNWQKGCYVPTKSDALVVAFRRWLKKYSGGEVNWDPRFNGALPPTPPREQLLDRYWTHVVNCSSCLSAAKGLGVLEVVLQVASVALIGVVAATKLSMASVAVRVSFTSAAILCFVASRWLAHFVYKNFHYHDYSHALR